MTSKQKLSRKMAKQARWHILNKLESKFIDNVFPKESVLSLPTTKAHKGINLSGMSANITNSFPVAIIPTFLDLLLTTPQPELGLGPVENNTIGHRFI